MAHASTIGNVSNQALHQVVHGNINIFPEGQVADSKQTRPPDYAYGLSLNDAPQIYDGLFVGREAELEHLREWLAPQPGYQNVVAVSGLGGIGKTQLCVQYAKRFHSVYSSVFWLNAKDKSTLTAGLVALAARIQDEAVSRSATDQGGEDRVVQQVRQWLSQPKNSNWLVVYDNYDDPRLPGIRSGTGYDIREFFPHSVQGSILITTRSGQLTFARHLRLVKLEELDQCLAILAHRSRQDTTADPDARKLANRLDGLPLALATAGSYLSQTSNSFAEYLQLYEDSWHDLEENSKELLEYEDRTLYSTWNLSLKQVRAQDSEAAELLRLMAYLGNVDLRYELFRAGVEALSEFDSELSWWPEVMKSKARFDRAMSKLQDYSLVEIGTGSYSMHTCVHDWTLERLNFDDNGRLCLLAVQCVARSVKSKTEVEIWMVSRRLLSHVSRFEHARVKDRIDWTKVDMVDLFNMAQLYSGLGMKGKAKQMCVRSLQGCDKAKGPDHTSTLDAVHMLGNLYVGQGKMVEAEKMYIRALQGRERAMGSDHTSTLDTVNNLGFLYADQGKMAEAEQMYMRALEGREKACGPEHTSILDTVHNLGFLYADQGKMAEAEKMYMRALQGYKKAWSSHHKSTLNTVYGLGNLYSRQGKLKEAENVYERELKEYIKEFGMDHPSTIKIVEALCRLLSESISKQMFQSEKTIRDQSQILNRLVRLANTWGSKSLAIFGQLGRVLLWNSDELNARIAFQQQVDFQDGVLVYPYIVCDGCDLPLTCSMKRFVCKRCHDIDICGQCFEKREADIKVVPTCLDHSFLKISLGMLAGSNTGHIFGKTPRELWMQSLVRKYSIAAAGPDRNEPSRE